MHAKLLDFFMIGSPVAMGGVRNDSAGAKSPREGGLSRFIAERCVDFLDTHVRGLSAG